MTAVLRLACLPAALAALLSLAACLSPGLRPSADLRAESPGPALERGRPRAVGMDPDALRQVPARMQEAVDAGQAAGVVTLVAKDGKIVALDAVGAADVASGRPMTADTLGRGLT